MEPHHHQPRGQLRQDSKEDILSSQQPTPVVVALVHTQREWEQGSKRLLIYVVQEFYNMQRLNCPTLALPYVGQSLNPTMCEAK